MHDQIDSQLPSALVAKLDHLAKFPGRIHMQQREWRPRRVESLHRQMQQYRRVLAYGIHHHRVLELGNHFAHDKDALGFELFKLSQTTL